MPDRVEIVSERFRWHSATDEIEDISTKTKRLASDYSAKTDVYGDRVRCWFLDVARQHIDGGSSPADYVALAIALSYVEGIERFRQGVEAPPGQSGVWFKASLRRIFPDVSEEVAHRVWTAVRCGLFHSGFTDGPTLVSHERPRAVEVSGGYLYLNPALVLQAVNGDFSAYVADLRANPDADLSIKFVRLWDERWDATEWMP